jgi:UPF0271 protein
MGVKVDLNCDMGESFGNYALGRDYEVMDEITSANIACGFHAGDYMVMDKTVKWAVEKNIGIGAHPGWPDLQGFGRRNMEFSPEEIENLCLYQLGAIYAFAKANKGELQHFKPHGNLYVQVYAEAMRGNPRWAEAVGRAVKRFDKNLIVLSFAGAKTMDIWRGMGLRVAIEAFPDREYNADKTLVSRRVQGAVIKDHRRVLERAIKMILEHKLAAMDGSVIDNFHFDTICVHGDNPETLRGLQAINKALRENGVEIAPMREFVK